MEIYFAAAKRIYHIYMQVRIEQPFLLTARACTLSGQTQSEGGFAPDKVSSGSLLSFSTPTKEGKNFYNYEVFTRTADGDEGGRHILISSTVAGGNLFILKVEVGDKRWFKGMDKFATKLLDSFTVV